VLIQGENVRTENARRRIGVLGHSISLYDELTATENLVLFGRLYGVADPKKVAAEWLERTGLERVRDGLVREFSRGMRQRLAVARAFLHDPDVLLFDEPFTSLDDRAIAVLQALLADAHAKGRTIIMSTHQLREALELATHVAMIQRGSIVFAGERRPEMLEDTGWLVQDLWGKLSGHVFRQALTIAAKDLRAELRTKEALNASLAFSIVILVLVSFAFDPDSETAREMSGGLLWVVFSFAGALALNRSFAREMQNDCLDALLASPVPPAALFRRAKALGQLRVAAGSRIREPSSIRAVLQHSMDRTVMVVTVGRAAGDLGAHSHRHDLQRADRQPPTARADVASAGLPADDSSIDGRDHADYRSVERHAARSQQSTVGAACWWVSI
jgi:ABC-type proline/glycine betaine transport system ATPase subunit